MQKNTVLIGFVLIILALANGCKTKVSNDDIINLPRTNFNRGGAVFSLAEVDGFKFVAPDSVGWAGYMQSTPENGQIAYFFLKGNDIQLASPHVRVEYISKSLPNCGSEKELHDWVKGLFLTPEQGGVLVGENTVSTLDEKEVALTEIKIPSQQVNDSLLRSGKSMAWAYVDAGEQFVAFNFTSVDSSEYVRGIPLFKQLVRSFRKGE